MRVELLRKVADTGRARAVLALVLGLGLAVAAVDGAYAQTSLDKARERRATSPFDLSAAATKVLQTNLVQCGLTNDGNVCTDIFNSPTGGGGFWPAGTANQYIFNSGLQIAGIIGPDGGPWAGDTVGAYFFDARGTQPHGSARSNIYDSLDPEDLENWPEEAYIQDTTIFNAALIGQKAISDQDTWVKYWDGDPNRLSQRQHPMGIEVQQRSLAFNAPAGAEHTIFFIYTFKNISNDPEFIAANEAKFPGLDLPDDGYTIDSIFVAFAMDPDVTTGATNNFSTAILPFNLGIAYHATFTAPDFNFNARPDLYASPFFAGPGFVGVKYLRSPINAETGEEVGLTLFSNTLNQATGFPDPQGDKQLFRYLSGRVSPAAGDNPCNIPNPAESKLCFLWQDPADTRFYQASGPFSLGPGESGTIVVAYTHGAPVAIPGYTPGQVLRPGIPSNTPGVGTDTLRWVERMAGWISTPPRAVRPDGTIDETQVNVVPRSLLANALVAQTIYNNKFLLPRPPEPPAFTLVPGDGQVTIVWQPSASETTPDPYYQIASDTSSTLYDPNYREYDVEGYRIYRATGLGGGFELIAEFDHRGTVFVDRTGQLDPTYVPEEGPYGQEVEHELRGTITMYPDGARIRDATTGAVVVTASESIELRDTGVPFAYVDRDVKNGVTYRYIVTAFDVNSLKSGALSLESPRQPQVVVPRSHAANLRVASFRSYMTGDDGVPLNPDAPLPLLDTLDGTFSGPMPPTNTLEAAFEPLVEQLLPAFRLAVRIDSIVPRNGESPGGCPAGENIQGACWRMYLTYDRDGVVSQATADGFTPVLSVPGGEPDVAEFSLGGAPIPADTLNAIKYGLPQNFPGFTATLRGVFPTHLKYTSTEGQYNRRIAGCNVTPTPQACLQRMHGGSRWFDGTEETTPDPTTFVRSGRLQGIDTIWAGINHTPLGPGLGISPASSAMQCFAYGAGFLFRAADVRFTWGENGFESVRDVTHNVDVKFHPGARASYGFLNTDANGNGVLDWEDFHYIDGVYQEAQHLRFCGSASGGSPDFDRGDDDPIDLTKVVALDSTPRLMPVSTGADAVSDLTQTGMGFGLYVNGERYIFQTNSLPAPGTVWTLRTYSGEITTRPSSTLDASGYEFTPADRPPMVPGLTVVFESAAATRLAERVSLDRVHTVPDPYYVRSAYDIGPGNKKLLFVNLPPQAIVRIYTVNGTLVRVLEHNDPKDGGQLEWDLRNRNNQFVASGVYFYVVESADGQKKVGRFTVIQFAR